MGKPDTCVFCDTEGDDFGPEHWVPQWVSRATIPKGKGILHVRADGSDPRLSNIVDWTVAHICTKCNSDWMSALETKVRNIALPLIEGDEQPRILDRNQLHLLARWCFMKAITLELGRPENQGPPTYPPEIYSGFKRFKQPPNGCVISIGYREMPEDPPVFVWFRSQGQKHALPPFDHLPGYRGAVSIKHLVIDLVGVFAAPAIQVQDADPRLCQIWPFVANLDWPPPGRFQGIVDNDLV